MYHTSVVCSLPLAPCESALILPSETGKDILANQNMMSRPWEKIQLSYYVSFRSVLIRPLNCLQDSSQPPHHSFIRSERTRHVTSGLE